jgi:hypothetical protein
MRHESNKCSFASIAATNPHVTVFCTFDKTFHFEVDLHAYYFYLQVMTTKAKSGHAEDDLFAYCKARKPVVREPCMFATSPIGVA